jgi:hypothetical protein
MERQPFGQFAFDVLKLFSMDTKRQNSTRDFIDSSHALEDQAGSRARLTSAVLRQHSDTLAESPLG